MWKIGANGGLGQGRPTPNSREKDETEEEENLNVMKKFEQLERGRRLCVQNKLG